MAFLQQISSKFPRVPGVKSASVTRVLALILLLSTAAVPAAFAQSRVTIAWDPNFDGVTAGYRVFVGTSPGAALGAIDVGQATSAALSLPPGGVYYVAVRGYTLDGELGPPSVEAAINLASAPSAPSSFGASVSGATASLGWAPPAAGGTIVSYLLSVGTAPGAANLLNGYALGNILGIAGDLPPGTYFARVYAANLVGIGPPSNEVTLQVGGGASQVGPFGLTATWAGVNAQLTWSPPPGATGARLPSSYIIEAGTVSGAVNIGAVNVGAGTSFVVDVPAGTYYVRVRGVTATGVTDPSNEIVLQGRGVPDPARTLTATVAGDMVTVKWKAPAAGAAVTSYVLEAGSGPGLADFGTVNVGNVTAVTAPIPPGAYYVRVRAVNARGASPPSNEAVVRR